MALSTNKPKRVRVRKLTSSENYLWDFPLNRVQFPLPRRGRASLPLSREQFVIPNEHDRLLYSVGLDGLSAQDLDQGLTANVSPR